MEDQVQALRYGDAMRACVSTIKSIVIIKMLFILIKSQPRHNISSETFIYSRHR